MRIPFLSLLDDKKGQWLHINFYYIFYVLLKWRVKVTFSDGLKKCYSLSGVRLL